jgi:hypothetical protein
MKLMHGRSADAIARANTAVLIQLIKCLKANGALKEHDVAALIADASLALGADKGTQTVPVQEGQKMVREMMGLL